MRVPVTFFESTKAAVLDDPLELVLTTFRGQSEGVEVPMYEEINDLMVLGKVD